MKKIPLKHSFKVIRRHLHIVALLSNEKERWNGESLASFLSPDSDTDSGVDGKTVRLDLETKIEQTLGINIPTRRGAPRVNFNAKFKDEDLLELLKLYGNFVVYDSSRTLAFKKLIKRQKKLSMWLLARLHFAAQAKKMIQFDYTANDMKIRKGVKVNPYYIINRNNNLFLVGKRNKDDSVGLHILDRIENLKVLDEFFDDKIPSVDEFFNHSLDAFIWEWTDPTEVTIRYKKEIENNMIDEFSHLNPLIKRFTDYFEMTFHVFDYEAVCRQLFFYGSDVEIVAPVEVIEQMIDMLKEAMSVYTS